MLKVNSIQIVNNEHLYGPGKRLLIVCQGCNLHCKGCVNKHLWPFSNGYYLTCLDLNGLDGITLFGGEPLDQADVLLPIVRAINKTIILFTGYIKKELNKTQKKIWDLADIVISGRFVLSKKNTNLQFRGSTNQRVYFHKGKYKDYKLKDGHTSCQFTLNENGQILVNGFLTPDIKKCIKK